MTRATKLIPYYLRRSLRTIASKPILSLLSVLSIAVGVAATMTMLAVIVLLSHDPIPSKSGSLYWVQLRPGTQDFRDVDTGQYLTWFDLNNLLHAHMAARQAGNVPARLLANQRSGDDGNFEQGQFVTSEFFAMFNAPFASGHSWSAEQDASRSRVAVLNSQLASKLFHTDQSAIGNQVQLNGNSFTVIGVLDDWHPSPLFYAGASGDWAFRSDDQFFIPLHTAVSMDLPSSGGEICWGRGGKTSTDCAWLQYWIQLDSSNELEEYSRYLMNYWQDQAKNGRFPLNIPPSVINLIDYLERKDLVPTNVRIQSILAVIFYLVCLFNACGISFARLSSKNHEVSIRRALGAKRGDIILQFAVESLMIGVCGGVLGSIFTMMGIWLVRQQPDKYASSVSLNGWIVFGLFGVAVFSSVIAAIIPATVSLSKQPSASLN